MKVIFHIVKQNPNCTEEIICENVSGYTLSDLGFLTVKFNDGTHETYTVINTEEKQNGDFIFISANAKRIPLRIG